MNIKTVVVPAFMAFLLISGCSTAQKSATPSEPTAQKQEVKAQEKPKEEPKKGEKVIDKDSGLVVDDNMELIVANCSACHSLKLVTQSSGTRQQWLDMIRYMQKNQGLWDLGDMEKPILDYLAKNYAPTKTYRRAPLNVIWKD